MDRMHEHGAGLVRPEASLGRWHLLILAACFWLAASQVLADADLATRCRIAAGFDERGWLGSAPATPEAPDLCRQAIQAHPGQADLKAYLGRALYKNGKEAESAEPIRQSAEAGSVLGWALMGVIYNSGYGVAKDEAQAVAWYRKAAEQGNARAQYNLGVRYANGRGVEKDDVQAVAWYRKAAEQGDADAQANLGWMYDNGRGVVKDVVQAVAWYRKAADQGDASAQYNLGVSYANGQGVVKDDAQAVAWYRKAAEQGDADAQANLGWMYEKGRGLEKEDVQAVAWYRKAAEQGYAYAQNNLGTMYQNGRGLEKDDVQAVAWYRKAAEQGYASAQNSLGTKYQNGRGVEKDDVQAVVWYRKAADQGDASAQYNLGVSYTNGQGVVKDDVQAVAWYRKAAELGNAYAQYNLGWMYEKGLGLEKDEVQAVAWYRKAAEQGDSDAQSSMGNCYRDGVGVAQDSTEARRWYVLAEKQNHANAAKSLATYMSIPEALRYFSDTTMLPPRLRIEAETKFFLGAKLGGIGIKRLYAFMQSAAYRDMPEAEKKSLRDAIDADPNFVANTFRQEDFDTLVGLADLGLASAAYKAGRTLADRPVAPDHQKANIWLRRAAERGYAAALEDLGWGYLRGIGTRADDNQALDWMLKDTESGNFAYFCWLHPERIIARPEALRRCRSEADKYVYAQLAQARMSTQGLGVPKDLALARSWLEKAYQMLSASLSGALDEELLGQMLEHGWGVAPDNARADYWYRQAAQGRLRAARRNDAEAQYHLGRMFRDGIGVTRNPDKARYWLDQAARNGIGVAASTLATASEPGTAERVAALQPASGGPAPGALLEKQIAETRQMIAERIAQGKMQSAADAYVDLSNLHHVQGDVDAALEALVAEMLVRDVFTAGQYGGRDNYHYLTTMSCYWAKAAEDALDLDRTAAALYLGKRAVNLLQQARRQLHTLDADVRECFLKAHENRYRWLADLMIDMGYLGEAEEVIAMLKNFETYEYTRHDPVRAGVQRQEMALDKRQQDVDRLINAGTPFFEFAAELERLSKLRETRAFNVDEQHRYDELKAKVRAGNEQFLRHMAEIRQSLSGLDEDRRQRVARLAKDTGGVLKGALRGPLGGRVAAVHSVVLPQRVHFIVTTPTLQLAVEVEIAESDLNRKIARARALLASDAWDARPQLQELHALLVKPLLDLLGDAPIDTLMLSLDGALRYLPFAALYDGEHYLVERYALTTFTQIPVPAVQRPRWKVAGFGVSEARPGFDPLSNVVLEINGIVRGDDGNGVVEGARILNRNFTRDRLVDALDFGFPVIHVASHFELKPGNFEQSALLLGNGELKVSEIAGGGDFDFHKVDLLTLSACQTAMGAENGADGKEVDSFASIAQERGAQAVMATLWRVADDSTARLMRRFYEIHASTPGVSKAESLRRAQMEFIRDRTPVSTKLPDSAKQPGLDRGATVTGAIPPKSAASEGIRHPFHWAPFILSGDWL